MHSNIMAQIMQAVFGWIMNQPFYWDNYYFTIYDYFVVCCIIFVMSFFVWHILLFFVHKATGEINDFADDWYDNHTGFQDW